TTHHAHNTLALHDALPINQETVRRSCATGDWNLFADLFAEDATYVEHLFGRMEGREAIRAWITDTMAQWPGSEMNAFPIGWSIIDRKSTRLNSSHRTISYA